MKLGCTANLVYIDTTSGKAFIANLGDSRSMYCKFDKGRKKSQVRTLSIDHKPEDPQESERIQNSGWEVV